MSEIRPIDANALKDFINEVCFSKEWAKYRADWGSKGQIDCILKYIDNTTTVEPHISPKVLNQFAKYVAKHERPKGEWSNCGENLFICSACGIISCCKGNFCSECGADMRGSKE